MFYRVVLYEFNSCSFIYLIGLWWNYVIKIKMMMFKKGDEMDGI